MYIYNSAYSNYSDENKPGVDLSYANFNVISTNPADKEGPKINVDSLSISNNSISLWESNSMSITITDDTSIQEVTPTFKRGKGNICVYGNGHYDEKTNKYTLLWDSSDINYYGTWELVDIRATDENGNCTNLFNSSYSEYDPEVLYYNEGSISKDLSAANFYVGIKDDESGIFISGNGMDNNVKLEVKNLDHKGKDYHKMYEDKYKVDGFYEISVHGKYNHNGEKIRLEFPVKGKKNGAKICIKHLLRNGKIQEFFETVRNGKVVIYVDEFSPFMLMSLREESTTTTEESATTTEETTATTEENTTTTEETTATTEENITTTEEATTTTEETTATTEENTTTTEETTATTEQKQNDDVPATGDNSINYLFLMTICLIMLFCLVYKNTKELN